MIDERRPIGTPLCYREVKKSREGRTREKERKWEWESVWEGRERGESRELIPGCIEALLSLWFADKLHGLNTAARVRPGCGGVKGRQRDRGEWDKKNRSTRNLQCCKWSILDVPAASRIASKSWKQDLSNDWFRNETRAVIFLAVIPSTFKWAEKYL